MDVVVTLLMLACVALAASAVTYAVMLRRTVTRPAEPAAAVLEAPEAPDEDADFDTFEPSPALPIDPDRPPKTVIYRPTGDRPAPHCNCHDRPLVDGVEYLLWPMDDDSIRIYCKDRT